MDNLYNSVQLAEDLLAHGMYVTGTLRRHRGEPKEVREAGTAGHSLRKGESIDRDNGNVMVSAWQDNRTVRFLSTQHDNSRTTVQVRTKGGAFIDVSKPSALVSYNQYMGGVDGVDQMVSYYPVTRRTLKWPKKVFWYFAELSIHNSHVAFNHGRGRKEKLPLLDFQKNLIESLCCPGSNRPAEHNSGREEDEEEEPAPVFQQSKRQRTVDTDMRLHGGYEQHKVEAIPRTGAKQYAQRRCRVCWKKEKKRKDTRYWCKSCNVALCLGDCFSIFHSRTHLYHQI